MAIAESDSRWEIISLDSMQVYRGMNIGTAKPTIEERQRVRHHLIDVADPSEDWSVARTQTFAHNAVSEIEARGGRAILVGGTGLYFQAVVDGLNLPVEDLAVRADLQAQVAEPGGLREAFEELQRLDPTAASRIDPQNERRIVRALEVIRSTGKQFSTFGPGMFASESDRSAVTMQILGMWLTRRESADAINDRVRVMRERGLVEEVARLARTPWARNARQAIGYKEIADALANDGNLENAFALVAQRTRSFARRQRMWFRRDERITWLSAPTLADRVEIASHIVAEGR